MLKKQSELQRLKSICQKFKKKYAAVWDIALYGSFVRGIFNGSDIDIAVLLNEKTPLSQKLELSQKLKYALSKATERQADVKAVDFNDFLDYEFLARQGILLDGYSVINNQFLHEKFGFKAFAIFTFSLDGLTESQKKMFYYALKGRRGEEGILKKYFLQELKPGAIKVPISLEKEIEELLIRHKAQYTVEKAMFILP